MKTLFILFLAIPQLVFAQKVDLKEIEAGEENTTIEISKGKKKNTDEKCETIWEVAEGTSDVTGESTIMAKEANLTWKKACNEWEKQFRSDNKENKIINVSCGKPDCTTDASGKVCTSKASYKIKTKLN